MPDPDHYHCSHKISFDLCNFSAVSPESTSSLLWTENKKQNMEGKSVLFLKQKTEYMQFFSDSETENRQFFHFVHNDVVSLQYQRPDPSSALHDDFGIGKLPVLDPD